MEDFDSIVLPPHGNPIVIQWLKQGKAKIIQSGCWIWMGSTNLHGYGRFGKHRRFVHRIAINLIDPHLCAMHSCDTPLCVNPSHIMAGSFHDNSLDMAAKGRGLRISKNLRCACGRVVNRGSKECRECVSSRLGNLCSCGSPVRAKGLCNRHYQVDTFEKYRSSRAAQDSRRYLLRKIARAKNQGK